MTLYVLLPFFAFADAEQQINVVDACDAKTHCCASMWPKVTSDTDPAPMD
jgi:hypothetical protein